MCTVVHCGRPGVGCRCPSCVLSPSCLSCSGSRLSSPSSRARSHTGHPKITPWTPIRARVRRRCRRLSGGSQAARTSAFPTASSCGVPSIGGRPRPSGSRLGARAAHISHGYSPQLTAGGVALESSEHPPSCRRWMWAAVAGGGRCRMRSGRGPAGSKAMLAGLRRHTREAAGSIVLNARCDQPLACLY